MTRCNLQTTGIRQANNIMQKRGKGTMQNNTRSQIIPLENGGQVPQCIYLMFLIQHAVGSTGSTFQNFFINMLHKEI